MLDTQEYLALAVNASQAGDHHASLEHLDKVLAKEPDNAYGVYLQAAEHAELGLYDRAIIGMEKALQLNDNIELARFQLGMLYLQQAKGEDAKKQFLRLVNNTIGEDLSLFSEGMLALVADDVINAHQKFTSGLLLTASYPALNNVIEKILISLNSDLPPTDPSGPDNSLDDEDKLVFLGAYQNNNNK